MQKGRDCATLKSGRIALGRGRAHYSVGFMRHQVVMKGIVTFVNRLVL